MGRLAGKVPGKGAETAQGGVAEGKAQEILDAGLMLYTVPDNSSLLLMYLVD